MDSIFKKKPAGVHVLRGTGLWHAGDLYLLLSPADELTRMQLSGEPELEPVVQQQSSLY